MPVLVLSPLVAVITEIIRHNVFEKAGGFDENLKALEDCELTINIAQKLHFGFIDEVLSTSYESVGSVSARYEEKMYVHLYMMKKCADAYAEYELEREIFYNVLAETNVYGIWKEYLQEILKNAALSQYHKFVKECIAENGTTSEKETAQNNLSGINTCVGCRNCEKVCPVSAIQMQRDKMGFLVPYVDESKCVKCENCIRHCPICNHIEGCALPDTCLSIAADDKIRENSTPGGCFYVLACEWIRRGGWVAGAVFDRDYSVRYINTNDLTQVAQMQGSKYTQSDLGNVLFKIKELAVRQERVLFSGVPCQIVAARTILSEKELEQVFFVDVICHGVANEKLLHSFLNEKGYELNDVKELADRKNKLIGWKPGLSISTSKQRDYVFGEEDGFIKAYLDNFTLRESCYRCKYKRPDTVIYPWEIFGEVLLQTD